VDHVANVPTGTAQSLLDTTAYNLSVYYAFRASAIFDSFAEVRATKQSHRGASVVFTGMSDMAVNDNELDEYLDVDAEALSDTQITITLTEFGRATISTARLRGTSFIEFDPTAANRLAYNAARSVDLRAQKRLAANAAGQITGWTGTPAMTSDLVREAFTRLAEGNVPTWPDGLYRAVISPRHALALKAEVGDTGWRLPMTYGGPTMQIYRGEIGIYEGFRFIVNNTLVSGGADLRNAYFLGRECLAKAFSTAAGFGPYPVVRPGPVTDKLWRFRPMGWYWLGNYRHFRDESALWASATDLSA
jgi:N4-gp56 family major capsid protein